MSLVNSLRRFVTHLAGTSPTETDSSSGETASSSNETASLNGTAASTATVTESPSEAETRSAPSSDGARSTPSPAEARSAANDPPDERSRTPADASGRDAAAVDLTDGPSQSGPVAEESSGRATDGAAESTDEEVDPGDSGDSGDSEDPTAEPADPTGAPNDSTEAGDDPTEAVDLRADRELHAGVTVADLKAAVERANTLYEVERALDLDREEATALLAEYDLLELIQGRVAAKDRRDEMKADIEARIYRRLTERTAV